MSDDLEPLSEHARSLLNVERARPNASVLDQQRVFERLVHEKAFAVGGAAAAGGLAKLLVSIAAAAVIGGAGGAALMHASMSAELERLRAEVQAPPPEPAQVEAAPVIVAPAIVEPVAAAPPVATARPRPPRAVSPVVVEAPPAVAHAPVSFLGDEAALIEQARTALLKNDFANARVALDAYRSRFPSGTLLEEHDLMSIQVLLGQHRYDDARSAIDTFRTAHPGSSLIPALDSLSEEP
ncbi:MAG: outer membrane protein assembly factor BamD [Archangiaceae bacterium]|nr:outer membrane protein assembly factor BamD [Archangiaceae bacterium]